MRLPQFLLVVATTATTAFSARILAMFPMPAKSHHILFNAVVSTLAERGHEVSLYTPYPMDNPVANLTIVLLDNLKSLDTTMTKETLKRFMGYSPVGITTSLLYTAGSLVESVFENKKVLELVDSNEKFDLVLVESFYSQEPLLAFGRKFNAPIISIHPFGSFSLVNEATGSPLNIASIPDFAFYYSDHMSLLERVTNCYSILSSLYYYYTKHLPAQEERMRTLFKDLTLPPLLDMVQDISLVLTNAHANVHYAQPYAANLVPVGGIHLATKQNPLPATIKDFLNEATHGVIYFSLGSILRDDVLEKEYFDNLIKVFRRLPQRVLWKTSSEIEGLPSNVLTAKWIPQQDVLAHPKVMVFMTHGGLFSQHEAINAGVPVVCIPFFCDQSMNAKFYEDKEVGIRLLYDTLSEETIYTALTSVLKNTKYKENMVKLSKVYRDRPQSPADSLEFWVEYVLRHGGTKHLRSAAAALPGYKLALLDVLGAALVTLGAVATIVYILAKKLTSSVFKS